MRHKGFNYHLARLSMTLLLAVLTAMPLAVNAQTILFCEGFEGGTMPDGWTTDGPGTWRVGTGDYSTSTGAGEGSYNALITHSSNGSKTKLITPEIDLSGVAVAELSFMHIQREWSGDQDQLRVYYRTSSTGAWTQLLEYTSEISSWTTEEEIELPNLSSTYQLAFEMTDGYGVGIDDVKIIPGPPYSKHQNLTAALTQGNGTIATLSWEQEGEVSNWVLEYGTAADFTGAKSVVVSGSSSYDLTGLTPETKYYARVKAKNGNDESHWSANCEFRPTNYYLLTVNDGNSTNGSVPIYGNSAEYQQKSEFIIPAETLSGLSGKTVYGMRFYAQFDFTSTGTFKVYLKEVSESSFGSSTTFYKEANATTVYDGTLTVSSTEGMTINFTNGFKYNGGNLLVGFYKGEDGGNSISHNPYFYGIDASGTSLYSGRSTDENGTQQNFLPKVTFSYFDSEEPVILDLADNAVNSGIVSDWNGAKANVNLAGRTLYKDGSWNTLCLPFDVDLTADGCPLAGATAKTLADATMTGTHVTLSFSEPVVTLSAGVPYIIKWDKAAGYDEADPATRDIKAPVFTGVTMESSSVAERTIEKADGNVKFIGYYDAFTINTPDNDDIYYMTADNTLKHTAKERTLKACRAYFQFSEAAAARQMVIDFGDGETTSLSEKGIENSETQAAAQWYTLDGMKLQGKPSKKGVYIVNGHKVVIK